MKNLLVFAVLASVFLVGCTNLGGQNIAFDKYENSGLRVSFEKPATWVQQPDPLALVRFGDLQTSTFAVTLIPNAPATDFDKAVTETYESFRTNNGLFNVVQENSNLAGFQAVKITSDQNLVNETDRTQKLVAADLYIVKDTANNRVLLVAFTRLKDDLNSRETGQRILSSLKFAPQ